MCVIYGLVTRIVLSIRQFRLVESVDVRRESVDVRRRKCLCRLTKTPTGVRPAVVIGRAGGRHWSGRRSSLVGPTVVIGQADGRHWSGRRSSLVGPAVVIGRADGRHWSGRRSSLGGPTVVIGRADGRHWSGRRSSLVGRRAASIAAKTTVTCPRLTCNCYVTFCTICSCSISCS